jgi:hypothetical protein
MADKKGLRYTNPSNETDAGEQADTTQSYYDWDQVFAVHLQSADLESTSNSESGAGIMGSPAPGEPNPAGMTVLKGGK